MHACMFVSWLTKMVQFECDPSEGKIRQAIEFPMEDDHLTERQFMRTLMWLHHLVDEYDPVFRDAIEHGRLALERGPPDPPPRSEFADEVVPSCPEPLSSCER